MNEPDNLLTNLPASLPEELIENIIVANNVRIERIISTGHFSPPDFWYDQDENEWVIILQGSAVLEFESGFASRFIPVAPPMRVPTWTDRIVSEETEQSYFRLIYAILALKMEQVEGRQKFQNGVPKLYLPLLLSLRNR
ncbi:hypothetical protein FACS1894189_9290 [Planctomycetales bacterium]|nr:hypothetical protein FACS1894189_9290 [Planctomycetales bacterium]